MGKFAYGKDVSVDFDDRVLAHLQQVITMKLRRGEPFMFSWRRDQSVGDGRTTVWLHSASPIVFTYSGSRPSRVNRKWLEALMYTANSPGGLHVVPEPADLPDSVTDADVMVP